MTEPSDLREINRRLDSHSVQISELRASKVDLLVYQIEIAAMKEGFKKDVDSLKEDFLDLRDSYRKLVTVAVGEAIGLLIAIVLIAVQLALAFGAGEGA